MEKEYYTKETYERLQKELEDLKKIKIELNEINITFTKEYDVNSNIVDDWHDEKDFLHTKNEQLIEKEIRKLDSTLLRTAFITAGLNFIIAMGMTVYSKLTNAPAVQTVIFCYGDGMLVSTGLLVGIKKYLAKMLIAKKEKKLKSSKEYNETLSKIEKLAKDIEIKEEELRSIGAKCALSYSNCKSISSEIKSKEQEIYNFEIDAAHLYLEQVPEEKTESKHKTRALVKENN